MANGIITQIRISPRDTSLVSYPVTDLKTSSTTKIINYIAQYQGLARAVLIDNQDGANGETVRMNSNFSTITIPSSNSRAINDQWIEQLDLTGASTNTQVTAEIVPLDVLRRRQNGL